jgi:hypothetical protein
MFSALPLELYPHCSAHPHSYSIQRANSPPSNALNTQRLIVIADQRCLSRFAFASCWELKIVNPIVNS